MKRRRVLLLAAAGLPAWAQDAAQTFAAGRPLGEGRVSLDVAPLVENGNAVPVRLRCPGARRLALVAPANPVPLVAEFEIGPRAEPEVATRIRLASTQTLLALAELGDGSVWQQPVKVIVTLAACIEGDPV
jgi:sulfur-oxidizing protein SoxY